MEYFSPSRIAFYSGALRNTFDALGSWPDDAIELTADEVAMYQSATPPSGSVLGADAAGRPCWVAEPETPIAEVARLRRDAIEAALQAAFAAGMPYTLPDGTEDVVQTRPDQDEANLLGLAIEARDLRTEGETGAVMSLRAKSNLVYTLTPEQMIALTDAAKTFKQGLLAKSWQLKDRITAAEKASDREVLESIAWTDEVTTEHTIEENA